VDGIPVPSVTAEEMREIDRIAVEETGPNLLQMMENAGRSLTELALARLPPGPRRTLVILAGGGGNGGGGICAARHLANRGHQVLLCLADPGRLSTAAGAQQAIFRHTQGREVRIGELEGLRPDLVLDALIGIPDGTYRGVGLEVPALFGSGFIVPLRRA
jgi:NAD(P)H-hydrate epimerase